VPDGGPSRSSVLDVSGARGTWIASIRPDRRRDLKALTFGAGRRAGLADATVDSVALPRLAGLAQQPRSLGRSFPG